ncbi:MAG: hypothetical protein OXC07_07230 [Kistimonas sp.]|nr:hypothetical protein [Kistimonas sp.]
MHVGNNGVSRSNSCRDDRRGERDEGVKVSLRGKAVSIDSSGGGMVVGPQAGESPPLAHLLQERHVDAAETAARQISTASDRTVSDSCQEPQQDISRAVLKDSLLSHQGAEQQVQGREERTLEKYFYGDDKLVALARAKRDAILGKARKNIQAIQKNATMTRHCAAAISEVKQAVKDKTGFTYEELSEQAVLPLPKCIYGAWRKAEADLRETEKALKQNGQRLQRLKLTRVHAELESKNLDTEIANVRNDMEDWRVQMAQAEPASTDQLRKRGEELKADEASLAQEKGELDAALDELNQLVDILSNESQGLEAASEELEGDARILRERASGFPDRKGMTDARILSQEQSDLGGLVRQMEKTETKLKSAWRDIGHHLRNLSFKAAWRSVGDYRCQKAEIGKVREQMRAKVFSMNCYLRCLSKKPLPMMVSIDSDGRVSLPRNVALLIKETLPSLGFHDACIAPFYKQAPDGKVEMVMGVTPYPGGKVLLDDEISQFVREQTAEQVAKPEREAVVAARAAHNLSEAEAGSFSCVEGEEGTEVFFEALGGSNGVRGISEAELASSLDDSQRMDARQRLSPEK